MKILQTVFENFVFLGININRMHDDKNPLNKNIFVSIFLCNLGIVFTGVFLVFEANNFMEYTEAVYTFSTAIVIAMGVVIVIYKVNWIAKYIERCENTINSSERKLFY